MVSLLTIFVTGKLVRGAASGGMVGDVSCVLHCSSTFSVPCADWTASYAEGRGAGGGGGEII